MVSVHRKLVLVAICIIEGIRLVIKQCVICGKEFDTKDRGGRAKKCSKKNTNQLYKQWYQDNREYKIQCGKQYYQNNCEWRKQYQKQYYQDNREWKKQYNKEYYQDNRVVILSRCQKYKDQHPEKYDKHKREKETPGLREAKKMARQNANYQCELTGWEGSNNVHHLNGYVCFPNQRADLNNLIVLATDVHKHFHSIYGKNGDNTIEQFDEFVCDWFPLQVDNFRMNKYKYLPEHTYNT